MTIQSCLVTKSTEDVKLCSHHFALLYITISYWSHDLTSSNSFAQDLTLSKPASLPVQNCLHTRCYEHTSKYRKSLAITVQRQGLHEDATTEGRRNIRKQHSQWRHQCMATTSSPTVPLLSARWYLVPSLLESRLDVHVDSRLFDSNRDLQKIVIIWS